MILASSHSTGGRSAGSRSRLRAFSLIELLVVIAMIGILATVGLPALRGIGEGTAMNAAVRQVVDDLSLARLTALNSRSRVCVVFLQPMAGTSAQIEELLRGYQPFPESYQTLLNIFEGQMASYAIITERTVGDQPGRAQPHYVMPWKRLPEGVLFAPWSFYPYQEGPPTFVNPPTTEEDFPFTDRSSETLPFPIDLPLELMRSPSSSYPRSVLKCLVFEPTGQLELELGRESPDRVLRLVPGSVLVGRNSSGFPTTVDLPSPDQRLGDRVYEETKIRVSGLTGRSSVEPAAML